MKFQRIVLADSAALALVGQASLEGLLESGAPDLTKAARRSRRKQDALAQLVLYDSVVLSDLAGGGWRIPILEEDGILEIGPDLNTLTRDFEAAGWYRARDPEVFRRVLARTNDVRPLVVSYVLRRPIEFVSFTAKMLGVRRSTLVDSMIDFAQAHYAEDEDGLYENLLSRSLPGDLVEEFRNNLTSQAERDGLKSFDVVLFGAAVGASLLEDYRTISQEKAAPVLSWEFPSAGFGWTPLEKAEIGRVFGVVRAAMHGEGYWFPQIDGIAHALKLRQDPRLKAFREQLRYMNASLFRGNVADLSRAIVEVRRAAQWLEKIQRGRRISNWMSYVALPLSVAETLVAGVPQVSVLLSVASGAGGYLGGKLEKRHSWVLFGSC